MTEDEFMCPRRSEYGNVHVPGPDSWREDFTCSYCGSLNPERFLQAAENGAIVDPTDKNYKAYIHVSVQDVMDIYRKQLVNDVEYMKQNPMVTIYSPSPGEVIERCYKFYFQHMDRDQMTRFVVAYNNGKMRLDYPGFFYTKPYFMKMIRSGE